MNQLKIKDLLRSYLSNKITFEILERESFSVDGLNRLCEAYKDKEITKKYFENEILNRYHGIQIKNSDCPVCGEKATVKIEHVESRHFHPPGSKEAKELGFSNNHHPLTSEICQECYVKIFNTGMYYSNI